MTSSEASARRAGLAGLATLAVVGFVGFLLLTGDDANQLTAGTVVMFGAVGLGLIEGYRSRTRVGLFGGAILIVGGSYGAYLAAVGQDPFTDAVVLTMIVVGLVSGLFSPVPEDEGDDE